LPRDIIIQESKTCVQCHVLIEAHSKFCSNCGASQAAEITRSEKSKLTILQQAATFYIIDITACCLSKYVEFFNTLFWSLLLDVLMAGVAVAFFIFNWTDNKEILKWRRFSWQKLAAYCAIAILGSLIVHYSVGWLNVTIYSKDEHYYYLFKGNLFAEFFLIFFVAIMPAIFEELGYRGYLIQALLKLVDREQAIYISSFLFAILHFSFISLFWLIPFALFLGYARIRENTIWYGVLFHFAFNLTACLLEIYSIGH
jgi:membrane protease YdiL (CAAX protease family)